MGLAMRRNSVFGGFTAVASFAALVAGLALIDVRVRDELARLLSGRPPSGDFVTVGHRLQSVAAIVIQALRDQSMEHAPLVIFALAAVVLVLFMTRT
jgi:hypothetical protein